MTLYKDLQLYTEKAIVEADSHQQFVATLVGVDLSEITGQVNIDDLLDNYDMADIQDYMERKKAEDI